MAKVSFFRDLADSLKAFPLWSYWAWRDIRRQYQRSVLGPFWITVGMAVYALGLNVIFGRLFNVTSEAFVPWVICGISAWTMIAGLINDSSNVFLSFRGFILQSDRPLLIYLSYAITRHLMVFCHHLLAAFGVLIYFHQFDALNVLTMLAFVPLFVFSLTWLALVVAITATRYRDIPPMIGSFLQVSFFVTPVMFMPASLPDLKDMLMLNPFAQLMDLLREPLLGRLPSQQTLLYTAGVGAGGWTFAILLYRRTRSRVAYWL